MCLFLSWIAFLIQRLKSVNVKCLTDRISNVMSDIVFDNIIKIITIYCFDLFYSLYLFIIFIYYLNNDPTNVFKLQYLKILVFLSINF